MRFEKKEKLSLGYISPYEILKRIRNLAYKLELPPKLSQLHDVFYICMLRKYVPKSSHMIRPEQVEIQKDLTYSANPVQILSREVKQLCRMIPLIKVLWHNQHRGKGTWKRS